MSNSVNFSRTPYTPSSHALRRQSIFFLFIVLLANPVWSEISDYYIQGPQWYQHATQESAQIECESLSMNLCSPEQLYRLVFEGVDSEEPYDLWFAGYTNASPDSPYLYGWFSTAEGHAGTNWLPAYWASTSRGAHCCSDFSGTSFEACTDFTCPDGTIQADSYDSTYCAGECLESMCCQPWEPAPDYVTIWGSYSSLADANEACQAMHSDLSICTAEQVQGVAVAGTEICSSGWYDDGLGGVRGWYVNEARAEAGYCDGISGWRTWALADGTGTAHCCAPSYHNGGYGILPEQTVEAAEAYCASTTYTPTLCTQGQVTTVAAVEVPNMCISGWTIDNGIGWYVNDAWAAEGGCNGIGGWRTWASSAATAHCCAAYVYEPELGDYGVVPDSYAQSSLTSGEAAEALCIATGYDGLCTQGQVAWVGTNDVTDMCSVGYAGDGSGGFVNPGYYHTEEGRPGCGATETWNDGWQPANALAHCCMEDVPEITLATAPYKNGGWDYSYATMEAAAAMCTGEYSLCSMDQIYTIATRGVMWDDGETLQIEPSICKNGWTSDGSPGWYQVEAQPGCGDTDSWNTFGGTGFTYHCCKDFEAISLGTAPPSPAPVPAAFRAAATGYTLDSEKDALDACQFVEPEYTLCTDAQVAFAAIYGAPGDGVNWLATEPDSSLCYSGWVSSDGSTCGKTVGWFQVEAGCGSGDMEWNAWSNGGLADAWCCSPDFDLGDEDLSAELGCQESPTAFPAKTPTVAEITSKTPTITTVTSGEPTSDPVTSPSVAPTTVPTSSEPTMLPTSKPSIAPSSLLCDIAYLLTPTSYEEGDEEFARNIQGVWASTGQHGVYYQPSTFDRVYQPGVDRELEFDGRLWTMTTDFLTGTATVIPTEDFLRWNWAGPSSYGANVIVQVECIDELPPLQNIRDCDAAAIASVGVTKLAFETYTDKATSGSYTPLESMVNFITLLSNSHIKVECRPVFASWLDGSGGINMGAVGAFMTGITTHNTPCVPADFDILADAPSVTDAIWGRCVGTNDWSNQGRLCGIWTLIMGTTTCREYAGLLSGSAHNVDVVNSFMAYFVGDYAENACGESLGNAMAIAPLFGESSRRHLQETTDMEYYVTFMNNEFAAISDIYEGAPDPWQSMSSFPPDDLCFDCASSEEIVAFTSAFFVSSATSTEDALAAIQPFSEGETDRPSVAPVPDQCPAVIMYSSTGLTLPYSGPFWKLSGPLVRNGYKYEYHADNSTFLQIDTNEEVWEVVTTPASFAWTSTTLGTPPEPPVNSTWSMTVTSPTHVVTEFPETIIACDVGNEFKIGVAVTGLNQITFITEFINLSLDGTTETLYVTESGNKIFGGDYYNYYFYSMSMETSNGVTCQFVVEGANSGQVYNFNVQPSIACDVNEFTVGGSVTGIVSDKDIYVDMLYTLKNGTNVTETMQINGTCSTAGYTFGTTLLNGQPYYVSVNEALTDDYYECEISGSDSPNGIISADVTFINIACEEQKYEIAGQVLFPQSGSITLNLWVNYTDAAGNNASRWVDSAELNSRDNAGGANWIFHTKLAQGTDWYVEVSKVTNSHTYVECLSGPWQGYDIQADVDYIRVECHDVDNLCYEPDDSFKSALVDAGFPDTLTNDLTICGDEYYYNSKPTCIGASINETDTCPNDLVCLGTIGRYFGTIEEQVDALQLVLNFPDGTCVANGAPCTGGWNSDECCDPYAACVFQPQGSIIFEWSCQLYEDCIPNSLPFCVDPSQSFVHGACPPREPESNCTVLDTSYALSPLDSQTTSDAEPMVEYCRGSDGVYYMNGISTCSSTTTDLQSLYISNFYFGQNTCTEEEYVRPFEVLVDDNLFILNTTTDYYIDVVDNAIDNCCLEYSDYSEYLDTWEASIEYIESQTDNFPDDIREQLRSITELAEGLLQQLDTSTSD